MRTVVVPAVALLLVLLPPGPVVAAPADSNEFLDMDLAQLMNITVTSVAKKEQHLKDAPPRCTSLPRRTSAVPV